MSCSTHPPRILLLYGSLRERSCSRLLTLEPARPLRHIGVETRLSDPHGLPLPDGAATDQPKAQELRDLPLRSEGQVWTSLGRHGAMSAVPKAPIDRIPLAVGAVRPTRGRTLAVMQVSGGAQSFNAVNQLRVRGRWMRMLTLPNQSSVAKAHAEFDETGRMKPSGYWDRVVDVMEELMKIHPAHPRQRRPPHRPLQRTQGSRRTTRSPPLPGGDPLSLPPEAPRLGIARAPIHQASRGRRSGQRAGWPWRNWPARALRSRHGSAPDPAACYMAGLDAADIDAADRHGWSLLAPPGLTQPASGRPLSHRSPHRHSWETAMIFAERSPIEQAKPEIPLRSIK